MLTCPTPSTAWSVTTPRPKVCALSPPHRPFYPAHATAQTHRTASTSPHASRTPALQQRQPVAKVLFLLGGLELLPAARCQSRDANSLELGLLGSHQLRNQQVLTCQRRRDGRTGHRARRRGGRAIRLNHCARSEPTGHRGSPCTWSTRLPCNQVADEIAKRLLNRVIVAHNAPFDMRYLDAAVPTTPCALTDRTLACCAASNWRASSFRSASDIANAPAIAASSASRSTTCTSRLPMPVPVRRCFSTPAGPPSTENRCPGQATSNGTVGLWAAVRQRSGVLRLRLPEVRLVGGRRRAAFS